MLRDWTDPLQLDSLREQVRMPDGKGKGSHHGRDEEAFKLPGCPSIFLPSGLSLRVEDGTVSLPFDPPQGREGLERSNRRKDQT